MDRLGPYLLGPNDDENCGIYTGDARELAQAIPDESVDLIFTDPPYPKEYLYCFDILSAVAHRVLSNDGFCLTYSGNQFLDEVMKRMSERLLFFWVGWVNHPSAQQRIWHKKIWCGGKPILMFSRNGTVPRNWIPDTSVSVRDKRFHEWGQGANVAERYISILSTPRHVVLDLFCGGGTVPAACKRLGRKYLAFEIVPEVAESARERIRNTQVPLPGLVVEQLRLASISE